ncbi:MAG: hypothetical protein WKF77_06590 [Planctomycetaceae bacterium]
MDLPLPHDEVAVFRLFFGRICWFERINEDNFVAALNLAQVINKSSALPHACRLDEFRMLYAAFRLVCFLLITPPVLLGIVSTRTAQAQLDGKIADTPIAIWYARDVTPKRMIDYVMALTEKLEIGTTLRTQFEQEQVRTQLEGMQPGVEQPVFGVAFYMVTGLIPSFETIIFQPVVDEDDARRILNGGKANHGDNGYMEELGNGCFKTGYRYSNSAEMPVGYDESQIAANNNQQSGWKNEQKIVEKDGKKFIETTYTMTEYCRLFDNVLYKATFDELLEMELPSADSVTSSVSSSNDLGFDAYLDRIPVGIRQLGWNMLTAAVGTQLQQHDDESDTTYNMRRSSGDLGLALTKAVLFDIDNSSGWARFASADDDSLRGELRIRARNNSELTKQLPAAAGLSQFAPILNDHAAATVHLCVRFPEEAPAALLATGTWLQEAIDREFNSDPAMVDASRVLSETLADIADHRNLELLAKIGWSEASGGVFYGGLQVSENSRLLQSLHHFMTHSDGAPPNIGEMITLSEDDGRPLIRFNLPQEEVERFAAESGLRISHAYLMHEGNRLWFAAGAENANEILRHSIDLCNDGGLAYRTPLVTINIDMERWLAYPQEDSSGIAPLPHWLDENAWWFPPNPMAVSFIGGLGGEIDKPKPIMQRVFDLGGAQQASLTVQADESGILVQAAVGEALANHMLARMIDAQEGMMHRMQKQQKEAAEAQQKALEEAASKLRPPASPK